jgi:chromosome partitioning protein
MASLKGGTGKTTVGLNLAVAAEAAGVRTVVVDVDPQQASAKWGDLRAMTGRTPTVISAMAARLPQALTSARQLGAELIVIDTAAHAEGILVSTIDAADLVLIPCRPTIVDLQYLATTIQLTQLRRKNAAVVLNAVQARTIDRCQAEGAICDMGLNLVPVSVSNLVAYARAITAGQGVTEFEPDGKAAAEMRTLFGELSD